MRVNIKFSADGAIMPRKAHVSDFCYDLVATSCEEVAPNVYKYGLGISLQIEMSWIREAWNRLTGRVYGFRISPRSSIWKTGMELSNSIGTIDKGYTGEISAVFYHILPDMPKYEVGDRIGQLHLAKTNVLRFMQVDELSTTDRGSNGYGSSGR